MAIRETSGRLERTLQAIVSSPPRATVTVGSGIVALLFVMEALSQRWPEVRLLRYVVPFLPPFIITRAARRIAERRSAHEFIRDAVPYVFVASPTAPTAEAMRAVRPHVMSDSASQHTGLSFDELFESEPLPRQLLVDPAARERLGNSTEGLGARRGHGKADLAPPAGRSEPLCALERAAADGQGAQVADDDDAGGPGVPDGVGAGPSC